MKLNENVKIVGDAVVLVPYERLHVAKYHGWMEDEEIRRLTGSERLSLEEEFEMQQSWRNDDDKLTFIVLSKDSVSAGAEETSSMIGDVNLFINKEESEAEAEVMIAEKTARGKGVASESLRLLMSYAIRELGIKRFFAKITDDNEASLHLFEKKLGFSRVSHSEAFGEYTLELPEEKMATFEQYLQKAQTSIREYQRKTKVDLEWETVQAFNDTLVLIYAKKLSA